VVDEPVLHAHATRPGEERTARRRRVASATWRAPTTGLIHGFLDLDVTAAETWWQALPGVTATHVVGCAVAQCLVVFPDARGAIVGGRIRIRPTVDVGYIVDLDGRDLTSTCIRDADRLDPVQLAERLTRRAQEDRRGDDTELGRATFVASKAPVGIRRAFLWAGGIWASGLGRQLRPLGLGRDPFGSVLVSSVGMLGLDTALAPALPYARNAGTVVVGEVTWQPRVVAGEIVPRRVLRIGVTLDHRLVDGAQAATMARIVRKAVEQPWTVWGGPEPVGSSSRSDGWRNASGRWRASSETRRSPSGSR
jgi:pyruvate dehydrogenase E2 component (dihydrolipoamide acetyltransferase)